MPVCEVGILVSGGAPTGMWGDRRRTVVKASYPHIAADLLHTKSGEGELRSRAMSQENLFLRREVTHG